MHRVIPTVNSPRSLIMAAMLSTGLETNPSSDLRGAGSSPQEVSIRLVAMLLGMSMLLLLAGWILLKTASGLQPGGAAAGAGTAGVDAPQAPAQPWEYSGARLPPRLPREWAWEIQGVSFEHMWRKPR
jgi:hypothetical protein